MNLKLLKNFWQQVLDYRPSRSDIPIFMQGILIAFMFGELFYDSLLAVVILSPVCLFWFVYQKKRQHERNRRLVGIQFRDAISSVLTCLKAGYSAENAFIEACHDMEMLYGKKSLIRSVTTRLKKRFTPLIKVKM